MLVVVGAANGRACPVLVWLFGRVLSLGFVVQEHVKRFVACGEIPLDVVVEPTFVVGLLLQLAFAVVAAIIASVLLASGEAIDRALAVRRRRRFARTPSPSRITSSEALPPTSILLSVTPSGHPRCASLAADSTWVRSPGPRKGQDKLLSTRAR